MTRPTDLDIALTADQLGAIGRGNCPDCKYRGFIIGPMAGMQINITCGGNLNHRFNVAFYAGDALMGHRLPPERTH